MAEPVKEEPPAPEPVQAVEPEPAPVASSLPSETIKVTTVAEASSAATRLLELATRNADELVEDAQQQAERILEVARTDAERLESDARTRSEMLDSETAERRQQLFGELERDKEQLGVEVENLRAFEREYRTRLKTYFEQQLSALDGSEADGAAAPSDGALTSSVDLTARRRTTTPDPRPGLSRSGRPRRSDRARVSHRRARGPRPRACPWRAPRRLPARRSPSALRRSRPRPTTPA